jgi:prepilin peptidase CpaA
MGAPLGLQLAFISVLSGILVWGAITDIRARLIPNAVVICTLILFFLYGLAGFANWTDALFGGLIMFIPSFAMFHFGAMGGGDAKLMTALAFWTGMKGVLAFCLITSLAGGVLALIFLVKQRYSVRAPKNMRGIPGTTVAPEGEPEDKERLVIVLPYGVAIAIGGLATIWLGEFARLGVL